MYPFQKHLVFTIELMYILVQAVCLECLPQKKEFSITGLCGGWVSKLNSLKRREYQAVE